MRKSNKDRMGDDRMPQWRPATFEEATDITDVVRARRSLRRRMVAMRVLALVLVIAAVVVGGTPFALQWNTSRELASQTRSVQQRVRGWPYPQAEDKLKEARAYNSRLAVGGQAVLGEAADPFATTAGGSAASAQADPASARDREYQSLLDTGGGVMGSIRIPKISVDLPIYHGTSEKALADGAGHLYGTSLPVGGVNTHAVITGHRGLVAAPMFTRLDEMHDGDFFYIEVMGERLAYQVDSITVIEPDDASKMRVVPGQDRVTLLTCTPYGVNTHRLLVSGHRVSIPYQAPEPSSVYDARTLAIAAAASVLLIGSLVWVPLARRRRRIPRMRHARPRRRHAHA